MIHIKFLNYYGHLLGSCSLVTMGNSWSDEQNTGTEGSTETYTGAFCFKFLP